MGNSVITEEHILSNIKAREKTPPGEKKKDQRNEASEIPVSFLNAVDKSDTSTSEDEALEEAQKMIQQLKALMTINRAPGQPTTIAKETEKPEPQSKLPEASPSNVADKKGRGHGKGSSQKELNERLEMIREMKSALISHAKKTKKEKKDGKRSGSLEKETAHTGKETPEEDKETTISAHDNREVYAKLKREIEDSIKALEKLKEGGFISEKEYVESRKILMRKLELADLMLHKETERVEIAKLRDRVMESIERFMEEEGINKERLKLKSYLQALQKLYDQGVIPQDLYLRKRQLIEDKMVIYDMLIDDVKMVFESFLKRLTSEISKAKEEFDALSTKEKEEKTVTTKNSEKHKEREESILSKLFGRKKKTDTDEEYNKAVEELKAIYTRLKGRESVSEMVVLVKRKIEKVLGIQEELTHLQLAERIKSDERLDDGVKAALTSFLEKMVMKEYAGELTEDDVQEVYGECRRILELIYTTIKPALQPSEGEREKKEKRIEGGEEKEKEEYGINVIGTETEPSPEVPQKLSGSNKMTGEIKKKEMKDEGTKPSEVQNQENERKGRKPSKKKSIFDRINEFFGV